MEADFFEVDLRDFVEEERADFFDVPFFVLLLFFVLLDFFEAVDFFDEDFFAVDFLVVDFFDGDEAFFDDDAFFAPDFFDDEDFGGGGTLPPSRRASDSPMAMACLRLVTFLPEPPLRSVPRFRSCIVFSTFSDAFFP